jgi:Na+-driven multidrug efflux pump
MTGLWMASQLSVVSVGAFGMSQQVLESLFVLFRVIAPGVGINVTQALGGRQGERVRQVSHVGLGASTWVGQVAALFLLFLADDTLKLLNAPAEVADQARLYMPLLAVAAWRATGAGND